MHPQQPWMMRINAENMQRDVEHHMRLRQARASARGNQGGLVSSLRRSIGLALIAAGDRIQPAARPAREYDPGLELELAR
jgi:hypothetical protein